MYEPLLPGETWKPVIFCRKHALFREIFVMHENAEIRQIEKQQAQDESRHRKQMRKYELQKAEAEADLAISKARESNPDFVPTNF